MVRQGITGYRPLLTYLQNLQLRGHIVPKMPLNVRTFVCPVCGFTADRDFNAALNIKAAGVKTVYRFPMGSKTA
ncbi:putative transposase DNA-binding domain protein [Bacteroidales bacterium Barb4]|nr:putative transposase DNA-binding domain protein [Bacteroidales bacterium Barb4]